jgi:acyl-CoA dehydrogenase
MTQPDQDEEIAALVAEHSERLFAELSTPDRLAAVDRGEWPAEAWRQLAASGFVDSLVPADAGGAGLDARDAFALVRLAGYHALPLPVGETLLARALWCDAGGTLDALDGPWTLATGQWRDVLRVGADDRNDSGNSGERAGFRLQGRLQRLPWGAQSDVAIAQARNAAGQSCLVRIDLRRATLPALARQASANLANEPRESLVIDRPLDAASLLLLDRPDIAPLPRVAGALLRAQQMAGAMQRCLELSLAYAGERVQFGQPIARFPAVQSMLVEAAGHVAAAGAAADLAATRWRAAPADLELLVAIAKSRVGEAAGKVAALCHQVHGAIAFTQEHVLHHSTRRLWSWRDEFGGESFWNTRIGELVCAQGAAALWPALTRL